MIDRRGVLAALPALVAPVVARSQQSGRMPLVALVLPNVPAAEMAGTDPISALTRAFVHGLRELGWEDGRNITILRRSAEGRPERAPELMVDVVANGVDVIAIGGARWLHDAALKATGKVPVVAVFPGDPVVDGLIGSLARPGGNLTGVTFATGADFSDKQLELLSEAAPRVRRIGFIAVRAIIEQYRSLVERSAAEIVAVPVDAVGEYERAFEQILRSSVDALLVSGGPPNVVNAKRLAAFAVEGRLPAMFGFREAVDAGGMMSYGPSIVGVFRQQARLVGKFLDGQKVGEVPTERPTRFELVVNQRSAAALGLTIPPSILIRADEVIE